MDNLLGETIRTLYAGQANGGSALHTVAWDGRNEIGRTVAGGVYFIAMKYGAGQSNVQKVVFLK
jgi:flagellar hook assembly protein FlgD